jgi:hypothetical protein
MIRIFVLVSTSFLFVLLNSPALLMPGHAWAACCGTTCKPLMCTCRGTYPCLYDPGDSNTAQSSAATISGPAQMDIARDTPAFTTTTSDLTESFLELTTAGKCFRDKLALSLLGNAREGLKFVPVHFDEKNMVAFLIDADTVN